MVKIRLKKFGAAKRPCYRIVIQDSRKPRDGVTIEEIGTYQPVTQKDGNQVTIDMERAKYWISVGAQPTDTVKKILSKNGLNK
ncbi:30S ribosomal protein S16 [Treponema sp. UBA3813]|uniref:30S ribosomal protein S16 n=1 Tax=Treponema sp. UBA3813 TaxID=1947715 RepID=UPI0025ED9D51|nr:30S ribosomal protein S16 [Treponema sp. UBA3813]